MGSLNGEIGERKAADQALEWVALPDRLINQFSVFIQRVELVGQVVDDVVSTEQVDYVIEIERGAFLDVLEINLVGAVAVGPEVQHFDLFPGLVEQMLKRFREGVNDGQAPVFGEGIPKKTDPNDAGFLLRRKLAVLTQCQRVANDEMLFSGIGMGIFSGVIPWIGVDPIGVLLLVAAGQIGEIGTDYADDYFDENEGDQQRCQEKNDSGCEGFHFACLRRGKPIFNLAVAPAPL